MPHLPNPLADVPGRPAAGRAAPRRPGTPCPASSPRPRPPCTPRGPSPASRSACCRSASRPP
eukprot:2123034-Lingulodinium_polyedra.AAC.1